MTLLATYECNRCGSVFTLNSGTSPHRIQKFKSITKTSTASSNSPYSINVVIPSDPPTNYDLCEDCNVSFTYFMENVKEFDKLVSAISTRESSK